MVHSCDLICRDNWDVYSALNLERFTHALSFGKLVDCFNNCTRHNHGHHFAPMNKFSRLDMHQFMALLTIRGSLKVDAIKCSRFIVVAWIGVLAVSRDGSILTLQRRVHQRYLHAHYFHWMPLAEVGLENYAELCTVLGTKGVSRDSVLLARKQSSALCFCSVPRAVIARFSSFFWLTTCSSLCHGTKITPWNGSQRCWHHHSFNGTAWRNVERRTISDRSDSPQISRPPGLLYHTYTLMIRMCVP